MSFHQEMDGYTDTPDRSLGHLSLSATGEQLDDIQVNLDRMYLESPAPASLVGFNEFNLNASGARRFEQLLNDVSSPAKFDPDGFDKLQLLDKEIVEKVEAEDWLTKPPGKVPDNFDEDDRSFLDTNLLYSRFNLLNFVTRVINEEIYAETRRNSPAVNSNLNAEAAGSGATFRVNRPTRRNLTSVVRKISDGAVAEEVSPHNGESKCEDGKILHDESSSDTNPSAISSRTETSEGRISEAERRQKYLTYRRPPIQRQRDIIYSEDPSADGEYSDNGPSDTYGDSNKLQFHNNRNNQGVDTMNGIRELSLDSSGNTDENGYAPDDLSPIGPSGGCNKVSPMKGADFTPPIDTNKFTITKRNRFRSPFYDSGSESGMGAMSQEIDTRTYTRPKKTRMSLGTPNRLLNTTMSPDNRGESTPTRQLLNTTIDLSPVDSKHSFGSSSNPRNMSPDSSGSANESGLMDRNLLNTTMDMTSDRNQVGATASPSVNLNETFVAEGSPADRSRRVTRNLSYVIKRDEESPNNNSPSRGQKGQKSDLNSTFHYEPEADVCSPVTRESQNTSMEDLNSRVASQIRSLGCSTISRGKLIEGSGRGANLEEARLVARTSSTDTYSVAHSSESPTSSGLSSPMDAQSYDDIQSESVRRSMPNLAVIRGSTTTRSSLAYPQAGTGQLRKNHYISDSKLSRLGIGDRPRLSIHSSASSQIAARGLHPPDTLRSRGVDRNTSTPAALNRISSGLGSATITRASSTSRQSTSSSMGNVRATGLVAPRYAGAPSTTGSGLRPPKAVSSTQSSTESIRSSGAPGIPVPIRTQSRIPAPGQLRFSRPPSKLPMRGGNSSKPISTQRGVDDWRDGCY